MYEKDEFERKINKKLSQISFRIKKNWKTNEWIRLFKGTDSIKDKTKKQLVSSYIYRTNSFCLMIFWIKTAIFISLIPFVIVWQVHKIVLKQI